MGNNSTYEECRAKWEKRKAIGVTEDLVSLDHLDDYMKNIANNINKYLKMNTKASLLTLSQKACVDYDTLTDLVKGKSKDITLKTMIGLYQAMNCSIDRLIK